MVVFHVAGELSFIAYILFCIHCAVDLNVNFFFFVCSFYQVTISTPFEIEQETNNLDATDDLDTQTYSLINRLWLFGEFLLRGKLSRAKRSLVADVNPFGDFSIETPRVKLNSQQHRKVTTGEVTDPFLQVID